MEKKKKLEKSKKANQSKAEEKATDTSQAKPNNEYGGLPDRDLKKNLGCG